MSRRRSNRASPCMNAIFDTLYHDLHEMGTLSTEYWQKQMHKVPSTTNVDRVRFLEGACQDKGVLHLGSTGPLHARLATTAKTLYGLDLVVNGGPCVVQCDLDHLGEPPTLPVSWPDVDLIIAGEVLEHLSNPGHLLDACHRQYPTALLIVSVPYAGICGIDARGYENVNREHVAWYSYTTLTTLLGRAHYRPMTWHWYTTPAGHREGLIMVAEP